MRRFVIVPVIVLCIALGSLLFWVMLELPLSRVYLREQVAAELAVSGVAHPVTAVLLNFRGYDTMLEVVVLFAALLAMLTLVETRDERHVTTGSRSASPHLQVLQWLARVFVPLMILVAGYLLWAGAYQAGGAFQAGTVLAGAVVLLKLADILPTQTILSLTLRAGLLVGPMLFFILAAAVMTAGPQGNLLQYPREWAAALILLIEVGLTLSLGLILAELFLSLSDDASTGDGTSSGTGSGTEE